MSDTPPLVLRGTRLRYVLVRLLQVNGRSTVPELIAGLERWGFAVPGRPSKTVSDALRWEMRRDRVRRRGRGLYSAGAMPRSTEHRIIWRVVALREQSGSLSLRGGHRYQWSGTEANGAEGTDGTEETGEDSGAAGTSVTPRD